MEDSHCCKCGKLLLVWDKEHKTVSTITGMKFAFEVGEDVDPIELKRLLGKYELCEYNFCFECLLDTLFK